MNVTKQAHLIILVALAVSLIGCPDPERELEAYLDRVEMVPLQPDMSVPVSGCGEFVDPTGTYFVSVNTNLAPGTPLLFEGEFVVDTTVEPKTAQLTLVPLTVEGADPIEDLPDRDGDSPVVSPVVPIDDEGKFEMELGTVIVTGLANAVSGSEIEAVLAIQGQILGGSFVCGTVTGDLIRPSAFDLGNGGGGSTFSMKSACGSAYSSLEPTLNCLSCEDIDALSCDGSGTGGAAGETGEAGAAGETGEAGTGGAAGESNPGGNAGDASEGGTAGSPGTESGMAAFGESCEAGSDCQTGLTCANINGNNEGPFCTRNCSDAEPCPEGYRCSSSQPSAICLPN